jgi:zinc protease
VVTAQLFYHAGGKDEPADKRGIAHMFEHMMFKGSKNLAPEQHARFIDSVGGHENAFTTDDITGYHNTVPPPALDFTLKLEAERMRNLVLIQKTIDSEREVVKEELRLRVENSPVGKALDKVLHMTYQQHPYMQSPIGEKKMLDTVTPADCQKFYDTYYQPNNALLIIVGDTDEKTVRAAVDKHFGPIPAGPTPPRPADAKPEPEQKELRDATLTLPVQLPVLVGAYHIPGGASDDIYALEVLQQILSGGESSRLYQRLVRKDKTAVAAGGFAWSREHPGIFISFAAYLPNQDAAKIKTALDEEIARVSQLPVEERELAKARNQLAARAVFRRERVTDTAQTMGVSWVVSGDPFRAWSAPAKYDAVTAADVQRVAQKYLTKNNLSLVTLQPEAKKPPEKKPAPKAGGAK